MPSKKVIVKMIKKKDVKALQELKENSEALTIQRQTKLIKGFDSILETKKREVVNDNKFIALLPEEDRRAGGLKLLPPPTKGSIREDLINFLNPQTPADRTEAEFVVDAYINQSLERTTREQIQQNVLEELGAEYQQNTRFTAFIEEVDVPTFDDISALIAGDLGGEELQTSANRPGVARAGKGASANIFNDYKIKENAPLFASLRVLTPTSLDATDDRSPQTRFPNDPGFGILFETNEFLLQATSEQRAEKFQIEETFGDPIIFAFGAQREIYTYAGILLNTHNFQWKNKFSKNYEDFLRISKTIEKNARVYLTYDDVIREGHILSFAVNNSIESLNHVMFSFSMYIMRRIYIGDPGELITDGDALRLKRQEERSKAEKEGPNVIFSNGSTEVQTSAPGPLGPTPSGAPLSATQEASAQQQLEAYVKAHGFDSEGNISSRKLDFTAQDATGQADGGKLYDALTKMDTK